MPEFWKLQCCSHIRVAQSAVLAIEVRLRRWKILWFAVFRLCWVSGFRPTQPAPRILPPPAQISCRLTPRLNVQISSTAFVARIARLTRTTCRNCLVNATSDSNSNGIQINPQIWTHPYEFAPQSRGYRRQCVHGISANNPHFSSPNLGSPATESSADSSLQVTELRPTFRQPSCSCWHQPFPTIVVKPAFLPRPFYPLPIPLTT